MKKSVHKDLIQQLWARYAPYWHICAGMLAVIIYLCSFVGLPDRVSALEIKTEKIDTLNQRIEDIAEFLQVPKRNEP